MTKFFIGIDLGGTKTEIIVLDHHYVPIWNTRQPTPAHSYQAIISSISVLIEKALQTIPEPYRATANIGIGMPGSINKNGLVRNSNTLCLNGQPFESDLMTELQRAFHLENDANCLAISEAKFGAGVGHDNMFSVIMGTGVGGGLILGGKLIRGKNNIGSEWGHNALPRATNPSEAWQGPACYCGQIGCIETFLCGPAIVRHFINHPLVKQQTQSETLGSEKPISLQKLVSLSADLERLIVARLSEWLARSLSQVINLVDPDIIILGGGVSKLRGLVETTQDKLPNYVFSDCLDTDIVLAQHGDASGVRGAAILCEYL